MENNLKHRWNFEPLSFFVTVARAGVNSANSKNDVDEKKKGNMKNFFRYVLWKVYPYHSAIRQTDTTVKNRTLSGK